MEVVNASNGRSYSTEVKLPRYVLDGSFDDGFALGLMVKDLKIALETAEEFGLPMLVGSALGQIWQAAGRAGVRRGGPYGDLRLPRGTRWKKEGVVMAEGRPPKLGPRRDRRSPGRYFRRGAGSRRWARRSRRMPRWR